METAFAFLNAHWQAFNGVRTIGLAVLVWVMCDRAIVPLAKGFWREFRGNLRG